MFQLRFLIASPRKMSPHIFCHRDYRGQRTKPDDFHPQFNTYVCQPKGTQTSYDVMLELMQSAAAHQSAQQLFSVVELFDPQTHERLKLKGDEIILRPSDLAAAQEAFNTTQPAQIGNATSTATTQPAAPEPIGLAPVNDVNDAPLKAAPESTSETENSEPRTENAPLTVLDRVRTEIQTNGKATATTLSIALNIDAADIKAAVASEGSGLQNKGGWISLI
jgi:hypothetical protein